MSAGRVTSKNISNLLSYCNGLYSYKYSTTTTATTTTTTTTATTITTTTTTTTTAITTNYNSSSVIKIGQLLYKLKMDLLTYTHAQTVL